MPIFISILQHPLKDFPNHPVWNYLAARLNEQLGNHEMAIAHLKKAAMLGYTSKIRSKSYVHPSNDPIFNSLRKKEIFEEINEIMSNATPKKVWTILTGFHNYPSWNPFIKSVKGEVKIGNKIKVRIEPPKEKGMTFKPKVLTYKANQELSWIGHLFFPGLFDGEHKFELIDNGNGTTTFIQSEKINGILVGLINIENAKKGFQSMNQKLKELAEQK